jgi:hypothetical protein
MRSKKCYRVFCDEISSKNHLRKLGIDERIILNWMSVCGMHLSDSEQRKVMAFVNTVINLYVPQY